MPRSQSWRAFGKEYNDANAAARAHEPVARALYGFLGSPA